MPFERGVIGLLGRRAIGQGLRDALWPVLVHLGLILGRLGVESGPLNAAERRVLTPISIEPSINLLVLYH